MEPKPFFQLFTCVYTALAYSYTIMIITQSLLIDALEYHLCVLPRKHSKHKMDEQKGFQKMRAFIADADNILFNGFCVCNFIP